MKKGDSLPVCNMLGDRKTGFIERWIEKASILEVTSPAFELEKSANRKGNFPQDPLDWIAFVGVLFVC